MALTPSNIIAAPLKRPGCSTPADSASNRSTDSGSRTPSGSPSKNAPGGGSHRLTSVVPTALQLNACVHLLQHVSSVDGFKIVFVADDVTIEPPHASSTPGAESPAHLSAQTSCTVPTASSGLSQSVMVNV
ncbi:unnamed protein product [Phytophthora lilii]|uniref:Unnamed protein product n=1 Tax=Phytophthora lilii TaxID=2077276 RepID=A0A9W6WYZ8_9STRA|nr:unnamed protein product [Phytophthora lilii]